MEIDVCSNLKKLALVMSEHNHLLYVVGGFVRNSLLKMGNTDYDIASSMNTDELEEVCKTLGYRTQVINKKLGTVLITTNTEQFEYTTFRSESYGEDGSHTPNDVQFLMDPIDDAKRRDFTINAMYYDIKNKQVLDYFNALLDLKKKVLKTVKSPNEVFTDDGLRILRLIRFVCELGFSVESKTLKCAKEMAYKVKDISKERILKEIKLSSNGALKYKQKNANHKNLVAYYNKLNMWQYVFNSNFKNFKVKTSGKLYNAYLKSGGDSRYIALMCLIINSYLKAKTTDANLIVVVNTLIGSGGLKDSNKNVQEVLDSYRFVEKILYQKTNDLLNNKLCIAFNKLGFEIKNYLLLVSSEKVNLMKMEILQMKKNKVPFEVDELKISNSDLIEKIRVLPINVSKIKFALYEMCVTGKMMNDKQILFEQAKFLNEKLEKQNREIKKNI